MAISTGCRKSTSDFPVLEDLSIAFQTMRHQVEELSLKKDSKTKNFSTSVENSSRITTLHAADLVFDAKQFCATQSGRIQIQVFNKKTQKAEEFVGELLGQNQFKVYRIADASSFLTYTLKEACGEKK